jgi:transglutaminase-like putative cysteine protease
MCLARDWRRRTASHVWIRGVHADTPTHGWREFDPPNDLVASEHRVKIAIGRDHRDVPPTRDTDCGDAEEQLSVDLVTPPPS